MSLKELAPSYLNRLLTTIDNLDGGIKVVNVGCGDGLYDRYLSQKFNLLAGVDVNTYDISLAKQSNQENCKYILADACEIPFKNNSFDAALCIDVIEHVKNGENIILEIYRILKNEGVLIIAVPHEKYPYTYDPINFILECFFNRHINVGIWGFGHLRLYNTKLLGDMLEKAGFEIVKTEYLNHYLAGLFENYLSTIFAKIIKAYNHSVRKNRRARFFEYKVPVFLKEIVKSILKIDKKIFNTSKTSVGILMKVKKQ